MCINISEKSGNQLSNPMMVASSENCIKERSRACLRKTHLRGSWNDEDQKVSEPEEQVSGGGNDGGKGQRDGGVVGRGGAAAASGQSE